MLRPFEEGKDELGVEGADVEKLVKEIDGVGGFYNVFQLRPFMVGDEGCNLGLEAWVLNDRVARGERVEKEWWRSAETGVHGSLGVKV